MDLHVDDLIVFLFPTCSFVEIAVELLSDQWLLVAERVYRGSPIPKILQLLLSQEIQWCLRLLRNLRRVGVGHWLRFVELTILHSTDFGLAIKRGLLDEEDVLVGFDALLQNFCRFGLRQWSLVQ